MPTDFDRPLSIGTYTPTEAFKSAPKHIAVCFEDDSTLVAVTGYADDPENVKESIAYARLFVASPILLRALEEIAYGPFGKSVAVKRIAREAIAYVTGTGE